MTLSLRLPNSLHRAARELSKREGASINQLIASALAEKIAAIDTETYLLKRAERGSLEAFNAALANVPDAPCDEADRAFIASTKRSGNRTRKN
ncbi:MAG: toxin-antitoxin system HicB family antitoxin [Helicobacteraceae bacterium]|jgi:hypothetical protein|nr:toxin-antitoxin system HicB family antitoxin [Helicobacteraceae bacterium]